MMKRQGKTRFVLVLLCVAFDSGISHGTGVEVSALEPLTELCYPLLRVVGVVLSCLAPGVTQGGGASYGVRPI